MSRRRPARTELDRAAANLEGLAVQCLSAAVTAVLLDSRDCHQEAQWQRAGTVAVEMALQIRLCAGKRAAALFATEEGQQDLKILASQAAEGKTN